MSRSHLTLIAALSALFAAPLVGDVEVADFEDVPTLQTGFVLPTRDGFTYTGLIWTGFYVINSDHGMTKHFPRSGYRTGKVSGRFAAVGALRNAAYSEIHPDTQARFDVVSFYITSAWRNELLVRIDAMRGAESVRRRTLTLAAGERQRLELEFEDMDALRISASGGRDAGLCEGSSCSEGPEVVLDDVVFRIRGKDEPPEPLVTELRPPEPEPEPVVAAVSEPAPAPEPAPEPIRIAGLDPQPARPPVPPAVSEAQPPPTPASPPGSKPVALSSCGGKPYYGAQLGAFSSKSNALALAEKLRTPELPVQIHAAPRAAKGPLYFVIAGCFQSRRVANRLSRTLLEERGLESYVTRASAEGLGPLVER